MKKVVLIIIALGIIVPAIHAAQRYYAPYDEHFPLALRLRIDAADTEEKAFPLFERALIIPDQITIVESTRIRSYDIVRAEKLDKYALIAVMEMDEKFDISSARLSTAPDKDGHILIDSLLRYKRRM